MKTMILIFVSAIMGALITAGFYSEPQSSTTAGSKENVDKPMYWVAPMDPEYRRDQPGKSPMGMELVPVYEDSTEQNSPGTVAISPDIVNNLGVRTATAENKALHIPIHTVGYVQYNQDTLVHIHPRVEGWIEALYVKTSGEPVIDGQPLYALYSPQLVNAQEEYLLAKKRHNSALISAALERLKALQMPPASIEKLDKTAKVQQQVIFRAPQSGVVDNLNIRDGFFVKPGTTLMSIGALDEVWVEAEIFERQAAQVKKGLIATMTMGFVPGRQWKGKLDYIYPALDEKTRTLRVRLRFANPERVLKPNMFAQLTIHSDLSEKTVLIPREAVIRTGQQDRVVLALGDGKFKSVEVSLGQMTSDQAQILSGLQAGDEVVTSAQFLLDSESSIDSDFRRMSHQSKLKTVNAPLVESATVTGKVNRINPATRIINISRGPIEKWNRGPATLDFLVDEKLEMSQFSVNDTIRFSFEIVDGQFVIVAIDPTDMNMTHAGQESDND